MRILITGVAGFIGSHLAERLLADGHEVFGIDNLSTGLRENVPDDVEFREIDVLSFALNGWHEPDVIYHAAASYRDKDAWARDAWTNVVGSIGVATDAKQCGAKIIYFQTSLCYGLRPASPVTVDHRLDPVGSYAVSKTAGEAYIRDSGADWVSLRLANVYGPRNLSGPVPAFYKRLQAGEPCTVVDSRRDFIYIDDLVDAAVAAIDAPNGVCHVATGRDVSILDMYRHVCAAMGIGRLDAPEPELTPRGPDDAATILLEPSTRIGNTDWQATAALADGVRAAVDWYREHGVDQTYTHLAVRG